VKKLLRATAASNFFTVTTMAQNEPVCADRRATFFASAAQRRLQAAWRNGVQRGPPIATISGA
jgi:hypothetical protein